MSLSFIASAGRQPGYTPPRRPHVYTKRSLAVTPDDNRRYPRETSLRAAIRSRRRIERFQ